MLADIGRKSGIDVINRPRSVGLYSTAIMMMHAEATKRSAFVFPNANIDGVLVVVDFRDSQNNHLVDCGASSFR